MPLQQYAHDHGDNQPAKGRYFPERYSVRMHTLN